METTFDIGALELDARDNNGIAVTLLWNPQTECLFVAVEDERSGDRFRIEVDAADALDAFHHPFAYAARRSSGRIALAA